MRRLKYVFAIFAILISACNKPEVGSPIDPPIEEQHTVLVYLVADNNLSSDLEQNIKQITRGIKNTKTNNNIFIYIDSKVGNPRLIKLSYNENTFEKEIIKQYSDINSASKERLAEIIQDTRDNNPETKSFGLIFGSHSTGWLPPDVHEFVKNNLQIQTFGDDNGSEMSIWDLEEALPEGIFDYIIFDSCLMGGVEALYELKNKTNYVIASTTEVPAAGMAYEYVIPLLLNNNRNLKEVTEEIFKYHNATSVKATMSLIKTDGLDKLAEIIKEIIMNHHPEEYHNNTENVQYFENMFEKRMGFHVMYDLADYIKKFATDDEYSKLEEQLEKVVISEHAPDYIPNYPRDITIETHCGLSTYILGVNEPLDNYYQNYSWYKIVYQ